MGKSRVPLQVAPEFEQRLKKLQEEIMKKNGKNISLRDLTENIAKAINFTDVEKNLLNNINKLDIKITMDRRRTKI